MASSPVKAKGGAKVMNMGGSTPKPHGRVPAGVFHKSKQGHGDSASAVSHGSSGLPKAAPAQEKSRYKGKAQPVQDSNAGERHTKFVS